MAIKHTMYVHMLVISNEKCFSNLKFFKFRNVVSLLLLSLLIFSLEVI